VITVTLSSPGDNFVSLGISGSPANAFSSIPSSNVPAMGVTSFQFDVTIDSEFSGSCTATVKGSTTSMGITFDI